MSTELAEVQKAVAEINRVETGLAALRESYGGMVYDVITGTGMEAAREARRTIRAPRFEVEKIRKAAKAPILALGKMIDSEAARITRELSLLEAPIDQQITAREAEIAAEKERKILAEQARAAAIQKRIEDIRLWPVNAAGLDSLMVGRMLLQCISLVIDESVFQEFTQAAEGAREASRCRLQIVFDQRKAHEEKEAQLARDQAELERLRAEETERQRVAAEQRAQREADDKAKRDADTAVQAAIDKRNREHNEMAFQEIQAIHHQLMIADTGRAPYCKGGDLESIDWVIDGTEKWELSEEQFGALYAAAVKTKETTLTALRQKRVDFIARQTNAAEAERLATERATLEEKEAALRKAAEPKPEPAAKPRMRLRAPPPLETFVQVLCDHLPAERAEVIYWLATTRWAELAA